MWRIWGAPNNASRWQMGFNLAFKGLKFAAFTSAATLTRLGIGAGRIIRVFFFFFIIVFIAQRFFLYKHTPGYMNFLNVPVNHSELIMSHLASGVRFVV
jgi:hypothetical protein